MSLLPKCWQRNFLVFEAIAALLIAVAFTIWFYQFGGAICINAILKGNRAPVYGAMASVFGSLLGFVITATSIVLGFSVSEKLSVLRESAEYPKLWKTFSSTIWILGATTLVSLLCLLVDKDKAPVQFLVPLVFALALLSVFRVARTIWALEHIVLLVTKK
jgi:hypothetical protein